MQKVWNKATSQVVELDDSVDVTEWFDRHDRPEYVVKCPCGCEVSFGVN